VPAPAGREGYPTGDMARRGARKRAAAGRPIRSVHGSPYAPTKPDRAVPSTATVDRAGEVATAWGMSRMRRDLPATDTDPSEAVTRPRPGRAEADLYHNRDDVRPGVGGWRIGVARIAPRTGRARPSKVMLGRGSETGSAPPRGPERRRHGLRRKKKISARIAASAHARRRDRRSWMARVPPTP